MDLHHPINRKSPFYFTILALKMLYFYPTSSTQANPRLFYSLSLVVRIVTSFVWLECLLHYLAALKENEDVDLSEDLVVLTGVSNCILMCLLFQANLTDWSTVFKQVADTSKFGIPPNHPVTVRKTNFLSLIYFTFGCVGVQIYAAVNIFDTSGCNPTKEVCGVATNFWWPGLGQSVSGPVKAVIIIAQVLSMTFYSPSAAILTFIPWEATTLLVSKIDHLKLLLQEVVEVEDCQVQRARLHYCVRYHQEILRVFQDLRRCYKRTFSVTILAASIILSCLCAQMLKSFSAGTVIHFGGYSAAIFLLIQAAQTVWDESEGLQDTVNSLRWYCLDTNLIKECQFVVMRCQRPARLDSVPFGVLNYSLLVTIVKTAYSFLTLITRT